MQKSNIGILVASLAILLAVFFFSFQSQMQINKINRKLTCIYNQINVLLSSSVLGSQVDPDIFQRQVKLSESSCDIDYIFLGIPK